MDGTIMCQGSFKANLVNSTATITAAKPTIIQVPSGIDWLKVYNYTQFGKVGTTTATFNGTANARIGSYFYWQRGMAPGTGMVWYKGAASAVLDGDTYDLISNVGGGGGFTLYDPTGLDPAALPLFGPAVAATGISNATQPVVLTPSTAGISVGSVVRLSIQSGDTVVAGQSVSGIDFVVGAVTANVSFTLLTAASAFANVPGLTTGSIHWRLVNYPPLFYPSRLYVTNIAQTANATTTTTISTARAHGFVAGQEVRLVLPAICGIPELNATQANNFRAVTILSVVDDYDFIINYDITNTSQAFSWPTGAQMPNSFPEVTPVGEDTANSLVNLNAQTPSIGGLQIFNTNTGLLSDSTVNTGFLGMILGSGGNGLELTTPIIGPAGTTTSSVADTIYWVAGKSSFGGL